MKRAIDVGLFGELADPRVAARLAARAEERGWHCGGTLAAITDRYAPVLRPETGTRIVVAGSGIGVFCHRLAPMALGKRRAQQFVQVLVAERVEIDVAGRARSAAEVRIGGDDLG